MGNLLGRQGDRMGQVSNKTYFTGNKCTYNHLEWESVLNCHYLLLKIIWVHYLMLLSWNRNSGWNNIPKCWNRLFYYYNFLKIAKKIFSLQSTPKNMFSLNVDWNILIWLISHPQEGLKYTILKETHKKKQKKKANSEQSKLERKK